MRRQAAQVFAAGAAAKAFGVVVVGALLGSLFGLMGLLVAGVTGNLAGQLLGPHVNRHTRRYMYPLAVALLVSGVALGFILPALFTAASAFRLSLPFVEVLLARAFGSLMFWLFIAIMGAVGYQRVR